MSTVSYDLFLPEVMPYIHDTPEFVIINAIRNACIEFCDKSLLWQYEHDPITALPNVNTYEFDLPTGTTTARIMSAWYMNLPMMSKSEDDLYRIFPMDWRTMVGRPQFYTQNNASEVIIAPAPQILSVAGFKFIMALKPTRASTTIDGDIYERWAEHIAFGARARLYDTPNQPYSDPQQAIKYRQWFESAIGEAKVERNRGLNRATIKVRPPRLV
jgi:hypothetical protein